MTYESRVGILVLDYNMIHAAKNAPEMNIVTNP